MKLLFSFLLGAALLIQSQSWAAPNSKEIERKIGASVLQSTVNLSNDTIAPEELTAQEFDYPAIGTSTGRGWSSYIGLPTQAECVTGIATPLSLNSNQTSFTDIFDREQLITSMKISAKASYGGFVSGRASFARDTKIDKSNRNILATVDVIYDGEAWYPTAKSGSSFKKIELLPEALAILKNKNKPIVDRLDEFVRICGDSYVAAIHNGARLNALFSLSLNEEEVKESMKLSISGNYGGFQGSASAASSLKKNLTNNKLTFNQTHWGGPAGVVNTPDDMLKRIDQFAKLTEAEVKPFTVFVRSYRYVSNWPEELKNAGLTAKNVGLIAGQVWRLQELGEVYAEAASAPFRYYFPYTKGNSIEEFQRSSANRSDALLAASACLRNLAAICSSKASCDLNDVFSSKKIVESCPALADADEEFRSTTTSALFGITSAEHNRLAERELFIGLMNELKSTNRYFSREEKGGPSPVTAGASAGASDLRPAQMYYKFLAEAPLKKDWLQNNSDTRTPMDGTRQLEWYCELDRLDCGELNYSKLSVSTSVSPAAIATFNGWIVRSRISPMVQTFCKNFGHPMCLSQEELLEFVSTLNPKFGPNRGFVLTPPPPIQVVQPVPPRPKQPREKGPCPGRPGNFSCL